MHIAIVAKVFPTNELIEKSEGDYMASTLKDFTEEMLERGHEITIIADKGGEKAGEPRVVNTEPVDMTGMRFLTRIPSTWQKLREENNREEFDLVLTWDWSGIIPSWLFTRGNKPLVTSLRGLMPADFNRIAYNASKPKYWLYRVIESQVSLCDLVIANSSNTAESIHQNVRTEIVHNGVNFEHFNNAEEKELDFERFTTGYFGRFSEEKGLHTLVESLEGVDAKLLMFGDGELKQELQDKAEELGVDDKIEWMGLVPPEEVASYMKALDSVSLPSRIEGFGSVILESMAAGSPVICSTGTGGRDIIQDEENGMIIEPENSEQLSKKLRKLKDNPELHEKISENGVETARENTWEDFTDSYLQLFKELQ